MILTDIAVSAGTAAETIRDHFLALIANEFIRLVSSIIALSDIDWIVRFIVGQRSEDVAHFVTRIVLLNRHPLV